MPRNKLYCFSVTPIHVSWNHTFPLDMLRYDKCYPQSSVDVDKIHASIRREFDYYKADPFINLVSDKLPTDGRWKSFGWKIEEVSNA